MTLLVDIVSKSLSVLVICLLLIIIFFSLYLLIKKITKHSSKFLDKQIKFLKNNALLLVFIIALISTCGSLFFSEVAGIEPCKLCWFQRIFMYSQAAILASALYFKRKDFQYYTLPLSIIGILISIYHNIGIFTYQSTVTLCSASGPSCFVGYLTIFGFINIPIMAFTGFLGIISLSFLNLKHDKYR